MIDSIIQLIIGRSREGAWIEIPIILAMSLIAYGRSREGAWIEINIIHDYHEDFVVAPVRERGLKFEPMGQSTANPKSLP